MLISWLWSYTIAFGEWYILQNGEWGELGKMYLSLLVLIAMCESTIISIKIYIKNTHRQTHTQNNFFKGKEGPFCELKSSKTASQVLCSFSVMRTICRGPLGGWGWVVDERQDHMFIFLNQKRISSSTPTLILEEVCNFLSEVRDLIICKETGWLFPSAALEKATQCVTLIYCPVWPLVPLTCVHVPPVPSRILKSRLYRL